MIENGVLDGIDEIYALHLCPELEIGKIGYCYGNMFAGCCEFDVHVSGKACHCAEPDMGADAIMASVGIATAAFESANRHGVLINLGKIVGGNARNIIADACKSDYTLRFYDMSKCESVMLDIEHAALKCDDDLHTDHRIESIAVYPPVVNHALAVDKVRQLMDGKCVETEPRNTAEDFANYLLQVPGCMVWLGTRSEGHTSPLHSDTFSFDERALLTGTELFLKLIQARSA